MSIKQPAIWFPTVRCGTGTDVFTETLVNGLRQRGVRAEITWLPHRAEYLPWTVPVPKPPRWATVAHVNTWLHPRFLPKQLPIVATLHHSIHAPALRPYKGITRAAYHRYWIAPNERNVLRRADKVIAVSHFVAEVAKRELCDVPIEVIYNGVDTERFRPASEKHQSGKPFRLLYVGSWMRRKGVDLLAPIMRELGDGFELRYTGGPASERDKAGMPPNMRDLGRLSGDEIITEMQDADALLFPTRSEGLPLTALEAMACGLPVIATHGSSLPEVVTDGETGLLCRQDDVGMFVEAVRSMASDPGRRAGLSNAAMRRVTDEFTGRRMIDAYLDAYTVVQKHRS
ncbi:MAG: glycosyltransferase family 4 protein [Thermomonas sp.]|uniref:glycosyltransferase family 4 protein n=1 Tax=Thermomonas sp. TaxID=1971895 RepID=UPI0039E4ECF5